MQFTNAPLPDLKDLFRLFFTKNNFSEIDFTEIWTKADDDYFWLSKSAWSLYLIAKYRLKLRQKDTINVWVPSYFCNNSLNPLRTLKINLIFYPITKDGDPDIKLCEQLKLNYGNPDIFLAVHYFGTIANLKLTSRFTMESNAWLVEDAAHILKLDSNIGQYSQFLLFSPHKLLPIPDGAILVVKRNNFNTREHFESIEFNKLYKSLIYRKQKGSNLISFIWILKRSLQIIGFKRKNKNIINDDHIVHSLNNYTNTRMSIVSERLLFFYLEDLHKENEIRVQNCKAWLKALRDKTDLEATELFQKNKNCPYLLGLVFQDYEQTEYAFKFLINKGVPVSTWPDLPPEVINNMNLYKEAISLRKSTLFIPVHRSVSLGKINF
tara:strand:+ start:2193 stop:3332 length:1140 start_codon:yes stop_codon:yes gene_type:complete